MTDAYLAPIQLRSTTLTLIYSTISLPSWAAGSHQVSCSIGATLGNGGWSTLLNSAKGPLLINGQPPVTAAGHPRGTTELPADPDARRLVVDRSGQQPDRLQQSTQQTQQTQQNQHGQQSTGTTPTPGPSTSATPAPGPGNTFMNGPPPGAPPAAPGEAPAPPGEAAAATGRGAATAASGSAGGAARIRPRRPRLAHRRAQRLAQRRPAGRTHLPPPPGRSRWPCG